MEKINELYRQKARQDFRIYKFRKTAQESKAGIDFLIKHMKEIEQRIESKKTKSPAYSPLLEKEKQKNAYQLEAEKMIRNIYEQERTKCENCQLFLQYTNDRPENLQLCGKLELDHKIESGEFTEEDISTAKNSIETHCNRYTPLFPEEMVFPSLEKQIKEIKEWLHEALASQD